MCLNSKQLSGYMVTITPCKDKTCIQIYQYEIKKISSIETKSSTKTARGAEKLLNEENTKKIVGSEIVDSEMLALKLLALNCWI